MDLQASRENTDEVMSMWRERGGDGRREGGRERERENQILFFLIHTPTVYFAAPLIL